MHLGRAYGGLCTAGLLWFCDGPKNTCASMGALLYGGAAKNGIPVMSYNSVVILHTPSAEV